MQRRSLGLLIGAFIALVPAAPAYAGAQVFVRVEGANATLLPRTAVKLPDKPITVSHKDSATKAVSQITCPANSATAALEVATKGRWDRAEFVSTILGETHNFAHNDYWAEWIDDGFGGGLCSDLMQRGDDLLLIADVSNPVTFAATVLPMELRGVPTSVPAGSPFVVTVSSYRADASGTKGSSIPAPVAGALVKGPGVSAITDAGGHATVRLAAAGVATLRATKGIQRTAAVAVCARAADGPSCRTPAPGGRPTVAVTSPRPGSVFSKGLGPRNLSGRVTLGSTGLRVVRIRLSRSGAGRCQYYSVKLERFRGTTRCTHGTLRTPLYFYSIGRDVDWSYLLASRLGAGSYALDVIATDRNGERATGRSVFRVGSAGR